jgi:hypothetical protein
MYGLHRHVIRTATADDSPALRRLARLDSAPPLEGAVLVAEISGTPVAAIAVVEGRAIADPFIPTEHLVVALRARAEGLRAVERIPLLRDRLRTAIRARATDRAA